jgi:hypothetical protein
MSDRKPPKLATAFLDRFGPGDNEALLGDLREDFRAGRSAAWYWRQAWAAVVTAFTSEVRADPVLAVRGMAAGWITLQTFFFVIGQLPLLDWFLDPVIAAFGSHPFVMLWATQLWFQPIEALAYLISGRVVGLLHPGHRPMPVVAFTLLALALNALKTVYLLWLGLVWVSGGLPYYWGLSIAFTAMPLLALVGGLWRSRRDEPDRAIGDAGVHA